MESTKKKKWYLWYFQIPLVTRILVAFVGGIAAGLLIGPDVAVIEPLGTLMVKLLQMIVLPLIFFAIVMGVGAMPIQKTGRVAVKIFVYYMFTTIFAATAATVISNIFKPGKNMVFTETVEGAANAGLQTPAVSEFLLGMIPNNIVAAVANASYLQVLVFSVIFGFAISALRDSSDERIKEAVITVYKFCEGGAEIMFCITKAVLEYTPIGVFALISITFAEQGLGFLSAAAVVIGLCYLGYLFQLIFVYGTALTLAKLNPLTFFKKAQEVMLMAFSTRSSASTLPVSIRTAEEKMGVPRSIAGFTLPLGSQINLDGEAYYQVIAVFTVAFASGIELSIPQMVLLVFAVTVASTGTAGVAGSGPILLMAAMGMVGLDVSSGIGASVYALILGIDVILDMGRTTVNVTGDIAGTCIVAKSEGAMDTSKWQ